MAQKEKSSFYRETNIKHLTHNTEHITVNTLLDLHGESSDTLIASLSSGTSAEASLPDPGGLGERVLDSGLVNSQIEYLAVTVKKPNKEERLEANVDFKIIGGKSFNKLVFNLVHYNRKREFLENLKDKPYKDWSGYTQAISHLDPTDYIGKGRNRNVPGKGARKRSPIRPETAMVISENGICHLWIEDSYLELQLEQFSEKTGLFILKSEYIHESKNYTWTRGAWK